MANEDLRRAMTALQLALDARTLDWQARHACDARQAYAIARRATEERTAAAQSEPNDDARAIASRVADLDLAALDEFDDTLRVVEAKIAEGLRSDPDRRAPFGRLFAPPRPAD